LARGKGKAEKRGPEPRRRHPRDGRRWSSVTSISRQLNKDELDRDEFWQIIANAKTFKDIVEALKHYRGNGDHRLFQLIFKKCMKLAETGFVLNEEVALWRRVLAAFADGDGIVFVFATGLIAEFRRDSAGRVRMRVFMAREGGQ
jgi:hypothetical protein